MVMLDQHFGTNSLVVMVDYRVLKGPGVLLGNPKDSVWEDWGKLGNIREPPPLNNPPVNNPIMVDQQKTW